MSELIDQETGNFNKEAYDLVKEADAQKLNDKGKNKSGKFILMFLGLILIMVLAGGSYWFFVRQEDEETNDYQPEMVIPIQEPTVSPESDEITNNLNSQSISDELQDIEDDLVATDLDELDQEMDQIEKEISS